jgi:hypothetical protein
MRHAIRPQNQRVRRGKAFLAFGLIATATVMAPHCSAQEVESYGGICDASAAVGLDREHFVVADDERNMLRIYKRGTRAAVGSLDLVTFLSTASGKESDLEGAATIGSRIFWISSHGRNKDGKVRQERYRFFATDIDTSKTPPLLMPAGKPYTRLLEDLLATKSLHKYLNEAASRAPESPGGLNIEGLASTPDGKLLIGFRNPLPGAKALLVSLENPQAVLNGQTAKFGAPVMLDLGGRGIRSIERVGSSYFIVAGPPADSGTFALLQWSGKANGPPSPFGDVSLGDLRPEALFAIPESNAVQILSDDGGVVTQGVACKDREPAHQSFRSIIIK